MGFNPLHSPPCPVTTPFFSSRQYSWSQWSSVLDPEVVGIWPKGAEKVRRIFSFSHGSGNGWLSDHSSHCRAQGDVNCVTLDSRHRSMVTGDDYGFVKLFSFPAPEKYVRTFLWWTVTLFWIAPPRLLILLSLFFPGKAPTL